MRPEGRESRRRPATCPPTGLASCRQPSAHRSTGSSSRRTKGLTHHQAKEERGAWTNSPTSGRMASLRPSRPAAHRPGRPATRRLKDPMSWKHDAPTTCQVGDPARRQLDSSAAPQAIDLAAGDLSGQKRETVDQQPTALQFDVPTTCLASSLAVDGSAVLEQESQGADFARAEERRLGRVAARWSQVDSPSVLQLRQAASLRLNRLMASQRSKLSAQHDSHKNEHAAAEHANGATGQRHPKPFFGSKYSGRPLQHFERPEKSRMSRSRLFAPKQKRRARRRMTTASRLSAERIKAFLKAFPFAALRALPMRSKSCRAFPKEMTTSKDDSLKRSQPQKSALSRFSPRK